MVGGRLYVANTNNQTIVALTVGSPPSIVAGDVATPGWMDGAGLVAQFSSPDGIGATRDGYLAVVDTQNHVLRKVFIPPPRTHPLERNP